MKKVILFLLAFSLSLHGQEVTPAPAPEETAPDTIEVPSAAYASTQAAQSSSEWRNWVFAGSAAVIFTVAVLVVTLNTGASQSGH